ncbi:MAG TPA: glycosyltransferase [Patescibacteria group bacterium]|jgi:hypothetical protein|nr:glycosyltransferase [Patescibacteria group bacterium]
MKVSIIVVNYRVKEKLFTCLKSIYDSKPKTEFEIIVVDNGDKDNLRGSLKKVFPKVIYVKSSKNLGYGGGNNLGAKYAKGKYLFFLNPDTLVFKDTVDALCSFLDKNPKAGIISPLLIDKNNIPFTLQGTDVLTPVKALVVLSFLNKLFPNNPVSKKYWLKDWDHQRDKQVEVSPGTALMIRRDLFNLVKGFDEEFFLYFEEDDLAKRVKAQGYKIFITSRSKIYHEVGASTKQLKNTQKIFSQSRFKYFRKHYGIIKALLVETFLGITKQALFIALVLALALLLRVYNLSNGMTFIGDQGWFYLSARDLLVSGQIPLVGITSSHVWLHQGPLWTYMLAVVFPLFKFNPLAGGYLTAFFGVVSAVLMYKVGSELFSKKIGLVAALLYATSPLIVLFDRMPFDPSPIPFFTILYFYAIYKWIKGNLNYFPLIMFFAAILYNLELATFTLVFPLVLLLGYGLFKKEKWVINLLTKKTIFMSFLLSLIVMLPVIIYDFSHGFKQTIVFVGWTLYKPVSFLFHPSSGNVIANYKTVFEFGIVNLQKLLFAPSSPVALILLLGGIICICFQTYRKRCLEDSEFLLLMFLVISLTGIVINQTPSDAYLPVVFPFVIFTVAIFFSKLFSNKFLTLTVILLLVLVVEVNSFQVFRNDSTPEFKNRLNATDEIIQLSNNKPYNLIGKGEGSQFASFTMNYQYLLWWKGHPVADKNVKTKIIVSESAKGIIIKEQ